MDAGQGDDSASVLVETFMRAVHVPKLMVENGATSRNGQPAPFGPRQVSETHTRSGHVLGRLIAAMGSTTSGAAAAETLVDALASLDTCGAAFVYRWDADLGHLVLAASAPQRPDIYGEEFALGEGVVGRAALRPSRPVTGTLRADQLARAPLAPDRAMVGLRVAARDGALLGVVALVADGPGPLAPATIRTATDATGLIAQALEHEQLVASLRLDEDLLGSIELLVRAASSETQLGDALEGIAELGLKALRVDTCAIFASDRAHGPLRPAAVSPRDAELPASWRRGLPDGAEAAASSPSDEVTLVVPALLGRERFGAFAVADRPGRSFSAGDRVRAEQLAHVVALAVRQRWQIPGSFERTRPADLLWNIVGPQSGDPAALLARARGLGCDLAARRVVIVGSAPDGSTFDLRATLQGLNLTALCDASSGRLTAIVAEGAVAGLARPGWSLGVSQPCDLLARYPLAYQQAQEAHDLGRKLFGAGRLVRYADLGGYRFIPALLGGITDEVEYVQISRLSDELLRTLEAYLDGGGNTAQAANQLFLHRNTVRQRLDRIATLLDLDLSDPSRWLSLQLVIKTARLARLNGADLTPHTS